MSVTLARPQESSLDVFGFFFLSTVRNILVKVVFQNDQLLERGSISSLVKLDKRRGLSTAVVHCVLRLVTSHFLKLWCSSLFKRNSSGWVCFLNND